MIVIIIINIIIINELFSLKKGFIFGKINYL
jgi:hypothetical protein